MRIIKYTKKVQQKKCPYKDTIIIIGSGLPIYWCGVFRDEKECIFKKSPDNRYGIEDAGECSYYLFPEDFWKCDICGKEVSYLTHNILMCNECMKKEEKQEDEI